MLTLIMDWIAGLTFNPDLKRNPRLFWISLTVLVAGVIAVLNLLLRS